MPSITKNGNIFGNNTGVGSVSWADTANAQTSNNSRATVTLSGNNASYFLFARDFQFNVPAAATITGIVVRVEKSASRDIDLRDFSIRLMVDGAISGVNKADTGTGWPDSDDYASYGGSSDMWGLSLSVTQVNAAGFGVGVSVRNHSTTLQGSAYCDHIEMTVHYVLAIDLDESVSIVDSVEKRTSKTLSEQVSIVDSLDINKIQIHSLDESVSITDSVEKRTSKTLSEQVSIVDSLDIVGFRQNKPLPAYGATYLIDIDFAGGTKRYSSEDIWI